MSNTMKNLLGILVLIIGAIGYFASSSSRQHLESFNTYTDAVRPHLLEIDAAEARINAVTKDHPDETNAYFAEQLAPMIEEYRGITAKVQAVQSDDPEVSAMREKLILRNSKMLLNYQDLLALVQEPEFADADDPKLIAFAEKSKQTVAEANAAFDAYMGLRKAYMEKHNLVEK